MDFPVSRGSEIALRLAQRCTDPQGQPRRGAGGESGEAHAEAHKAGRTREPRRTSISSTVPLRLRRPSPSNDPLFADVSAAWGPRETGLCADRRGDTPRSPTSTTTASPTLYGAGEGFLFRNTGAKFEIVADRASIRWPAKVGPALSITPRWPLWTSSSRRPTERKLYRNLGGCKFSDVTANRDLGKNLGSPSGGMGRLR